VSAAGRGIKIAPAPLDEATLPALAALPKLPAPGDPGELVGRRLPAAGVRAPARGLFRRRRNRRITVSVRSPVVWLVGAVQRAAKASVVVLKGLATVAFLAGVAFAGERAVRHVIASPRFAVREVRIGATQHVGHDDLLALAAVAPGDRLLAIDTDAVAARVAGHPWVASARVRRELPSVLTIEVTERRAAAVALLGGLYLVDDTGRPFKRATLEEADGLVILTGLSREQYASWRAASEAAFREALAILAEYRASDPVQAQRWRSAGVPGTAARPTRPALSEIHVDPRFGFSLVLSDGGGEVRLGRGDYGDKLGRLDRIVAWVAQGGRTAAALRLVHLDGPARDRVPIRLAEAAAGAAPGAAVVTATATTDKKFRGGVKRGED
jgi:cell division protein FtsQ